MIHEGHMKDLECIFGDSKFLAKPLFWCLIPRCGEGVLEQGGLSSLSGRLSVQCRRLIWFAARRLERAVHNSESANELHPYTGFIEQEAPVLIMKPVEYR